MRSIRYVLFLGCLIPTRFPQFEYLARKTLAQLGIELVDAEGFTCCPDPVRFGAADRFTWLVDFVSHLYIYPFYCKSGITGTAYVSPKSKPGARRGWP